MIAGMMINHLDLPSIQSLFLKLIFSRHSFCAFYMIKQPSMEKPEFLSPRDSIFHTEFLVRENQEQGFAGGYSFHFGNSSGESGIPADFPESGSRGVSL